MKKYTILSLSLMAMPMLVFAATQTTKGLEGAMTTIATLMKTAMPLIISLAVIFFVWSLVQFMLKEGEDKAAAKTSMIWGIIILFAMVSVWGLVNVLDQTFNLENQAPTVDWVVN